jgi:anti-sigma factor RsiW
MTHPGDLLHAYLDNELDAPRALEIHQHLAECEACRAELAAADHVRSAVKRTGRAEPSPALMRRLRRPRWRRAAPVLVAAAVAVALFVVVPREDRAAELASAHAASLMAEHTVDVASSDRHTVKPWFQGKVPYSLPVADFAEQGFSLEGGRLQAVGGRTYAVLVYRHGAHVISAFAWPEAVGPVRDVSRGFHLLAAEAGGVHFVLVSDASGEVLSELATLMRSP